MPNFLFLSINLRPSPAVSFPSCSRLLIQAKQLSFVKAYRSDGRIVRLVRASTSEAVDSGLIPSGIKPITLKLVFTASLLDAQH